MIIHQIPYIGWLISPTRRWVEAHKDGAASAQDKGDVLRRFSKVSCNVEVLLAFLLCVLTPTLPKTWMLVGTWLVIWYAVSRIYEIIFAFYGDAVRQLKSEPRTSNLLHMERVFMAIKSYFGLIVCFAALYYFIPIDMFETTVNEPKNLNDSIGGFEALYFSTVTITTLGYGDIQPVEWPSRLLVMLQTVSGLFLLVVSVACYLGTSATNESA